jgi:hypothetical protein
MNYKKQISVLILFSLLLFSCKTTKDVNRQKEDRNLTETTRTITKRVGDTVRYVVPNVIFKDTVIKVRNRQGTTQVLRYDNTGRLTETECLSSVVDIIEENNRILIENINNMNKHKEVEIPTNIILYFFLGLTFLIAIVMTVFFFIMKKYVKALLPLT